MMFQSLIGIISYFNINLVLGEILQIVFQSLIGIISYFNATELKAEDIKAIKGVSIPDRDYKLFQPQASETLDLFGFRGSILTT